MSERADVWKQSAAAEMATGDLAGSGVLTESVKRS